jgi:hypothetical protein
MGLYHGYGTVTKEYKTIKPNKSMCSGCYDNFYNCGGVNGSTKECWSFKTAKVVDKIAYPNIHCNDSQREKYEKTLSCYHSVNK